MNLCKIIEGEPICNPDRNHMHDECEFYKKCTTCKFIINCPVCDHKNNVYCSNEDAVTSAFMGADKED